MDQVVADGETDQVAEAAEIHFAHDVVAMAFHRARGDADHRGGFLVAFSAGEQLHHFQLASRQRLVIVGIVVSRAGVANETLGHAHGEFAGEEWFVLLDVADGVDQFDIGVGFEQVTAGAAAHHLARDFFGEVHGEDEHIGGWQFFADQPGNLQTIFFGHGEVNDYQVGTLSSPPNTALRHRWPLPRKLRRPGWIRARCEFLDVRPNDRRR